MSHKSTEQQCIAAGCENTRSGGIFVGEFCAPCYSSIRDGLYLHGTSKAHRMAAKLRELADEPYLGLAGNYRVLCPICLSDKTTGEL